MQAGEEQKREKLIGLIRETIRRDGELREKYQIKEKFRFISDQLQTLLEQVEKALPSKKERESLTAVELTSDDVKIYVCLYNVNGTSLSTWGKMLNPAYFYEYSVNRPIFEEQSQVDTFLRHKSNQIQYGYLVIAIKKENILKTSNLNAEEGIENKMIKVKEGSLRFNRLLYFVHNGIEYTLNADKELIKKNP